MINFRYEIIQKLGEGGSGEVFLVQDTLRDNRQVALKVLHSAEKIGAESDEAFRNEVSALLNLTHPNLVRIFDFGMIREADPPALRQRRFFTMELMRGTDALEWIAVVTVQKEKERLLELLLMQALSVLAYIHREGIIHFDIKPQNLVLVGAQSPAGTPLLKLTDFGFAKKQEQVSDVEVRGTLEYTAPEMIRGEAFDSRVDLYSLGATFFHLVEGHCPFESSSPVELAKLVLTEEPLFHAETLPEGSRLRHVILGLLQKDPQKRFRDAEEAALALVEGMPAGNDLLESYFGLSKQPKFVGRTNERKQIDEAIANISTKQPVATPVVVISGGEGMGKSALLHESMKLARSFDIPVFEIEEAQSGIPFSPIREAIELLASELQSFSEEGRSLFAKHKQILGIDKRIDAAVLQQWAQEKDKFVELVARFVLDCAEMFPFVVVADNLDKLGDQSVAVLRTLTRDVEHGNILLLVAETGEQATIIPASTGMEIHLRELSLPEVSEMNTSVLGDGEISRDIGSRIYQLYGGTPGILVEALNAVSYLIPKEALRDKTQGKDFLSSFEAKLPRNMDDLILGRFQKLGRERQLILNVLSCFKNPTTIELLGSILPFHKERMIDQLRYLQLEGFVGTSEGGQMLTLRLSRLKDAIYASITEEKEDLHSLIAGTLETLPGEISFIRLQELGFQFARGGNTVKAVLYYEKAADDGVRLFAYDQALKLYDAAIQIVVASGDKGRELEIKSKYVDALFRAGLFRESITLGKVLLESPAIAPQDSMPLWKAVGLSLSRLGETEEAQECISIVLRFSKDEIEKLELKQELVGLKISSGRFQEAEEESREQLEQATLLHNDRVTAAIYTDLGIAAFFQDRFDYAAECFGGALNKYEELKDKTQITNSMNNIGNALSAKGDFTKAISFWERGLKASQDFGTLIQQAQIQNNLGIAHFNLKQYKKAKEFYMQARQMYERLNSRIGLAYALTNLGEVLFAEGEYEGALMRWREGKELYRSMDNAQALTETCLHLAGVLSRIGDTDTMCTQLDEAERLIDERKLDTFSARCQYLRGLLLLARQDFGAAEDVLSKARESYRSDRLENMYWNSTLKLAEAMHAAGKSREAIGLINELLKNVEVKKNSVILAEINYLTGVIAIAKQEVVPEKAISYFKLGIEAIAKEPVSETTWKLTFALAREYYERGQHDRAKEFLLKTKLVVQFFLSHFQSPDLKQRYLSVDQKQKVLATIEAITKQ